MRAIDSDLLKKVLYEDYYQNGMIYPEYHSEVMRIVNNAIDAMPTIEFTPDKVGTWTRTNFGDNNLDVRFRCSLCGKYTAYSEKYCQNCGARIMGVVGDEND